MTRARRYRAWTSKALLVSFLWPAVAACGDGETVVEGMPPPPPARESNGDNTQNTRRQRRNATPDEEAIELTAATGINRLVFGEGSRDPFMRMFPDLPVETTANPDQPTVELAPEEANPEEWGPLAQYPIEALQLVAIISRTSEPRAMFMIPDGSGRGVLARIEDRVGPDGTGRISDIQPNSVEITYDAVEYNTTEGARRLLLPLRDPSESIEAQFTPY
jgi:Tfp pilus assembly protein PilP